MTEGMLVVYSQKKMADAPRVPQFIENLGAGKFLGGIPNDLIVWVPIAIFLIFVLRRTDATAAGMPDGTFEWGGRRFIKKGQRITLENRTTLAGSAITMLDALRMRFDQSMRVLKQLLERNELGTIEMRAIPHWQPFLASYQRLTLLNMSIRHLDVLRFLFGDPVEIYTAVRRDPRTEFGHTDRNTEWNERFCSIFSQSVLKSTEKPAARFLTFRQL
jgi:hypothetical protein